MFQSRGALSRSRSLAPAFDKFPPCKASAPIFVSRTRNIGKAGQVQNSGKPMRVHG